MRAAVCFFNCKASHKTIKEALRDIRVLVEPPRPTVNLYEYNPGKPRLHLYEQKRNFNLPGTLRREARERGALELRFALKATMPQNTSSEAADWLEGIMNQLFQSPVFREGEKFVSGIIHEIDGAIGKFASR